MSFAAVEHAIQEIRAGRMVILVDDEDRENEGDLTMAAQCVTPEAINFMAKYGRGLICLTLTEERLNQLQIPMMVEQNASSYGTAFTVSIEASRGVSTGISAADRAHTILTAVHPHAKPADVVSPGHIFPLRARKGGVLVRTGQTEGSVDLARLAGLDPSGVICEIMNDDGTMARMPDLEQFAAEHRIPIISIADLIHYRLAHESLVTCLASREVKHPTLGDITAHVYASVLDDRQHLVLVKNNLHQQSAPLVRVHAGYSLSNIVEDLFGDHRSLMQAAFDKIAQAGCGVFVALDAGEPAITLEQRLAQLGMPRARPEAPVVLRELGIGAQILRDLGLSTITLLSQQSKRLPGLEGYGIHVANVEPLYGDTP